MYFDYLKTRIITSRKILENLDENELKEGVLLANIDSVRNSVFDILDHSINHFSNRSARDNDRIFFPILATHKGIDDLRSDSRYLVVKSIMGEDACKFLEGAYEINERHDRCLNLLKTSSKHRSTDKISKTKNGISAIYHCFGTPEIEQDIYGNLNIPGFMHGINNAHISGCCFSAPNGVTIIESLDTVRIEGNALIIQEGDRGIEVLIKPFLKNCLDCTEEIIDFWDTFNKK